MRVQVLSDLHADFAENLRLIRGLGAAGRDRDVLLVPGDITHRIGRLREVLAYLRDAFHAVFFVPGNHDLWSLGEGEEDSLRKFHTLLELCASLDVGCKPGVVGQGGEAVCIVPLFSWYTQAEEGPDTLYRPKPGESESLDIWADFSCIRWPGAPGFPAAPHFLALNEPLPRTSLPRISFSHFLPRQDLIFPSSRAAHAPDPAPGFNFSRVAGTSALDAQLRALGSAVHAYGHQHRDRCRLVDGVWYVSHCLGYPRERELSGVREKRPMTIWDETGCLLKESGAAE